MITISLSILGAILLSLFVWAFLTFMLLMESNPKDWKTVAGMCLFTATPIWLGWLIYALEHFEVIVFVP